MGGHGANEPRRPQCIAAWVQLEHLGLRTVPVTFYLTSDPAGFIPKRNRNTSTERNVQAALSNSLRLEVPPTAHQEKQRQVMDYGPWSKERADTPQSV